MGSYLIKNVNIIDGYYPVSIKEGYDILICNNKIEKIDKNIEFKGKIFDKQGAYVIPGLINMHAHLPGSGKVGKKKVADMQKLISFINSSALTREIGIYVEASLARMELLSGVTTVRSVGGIGTCDTKLSERIKKRKVVGPRLLASNEAICSPGGHMEGTVARTASTIEEAKSLVEKAKQQGVDLIKLMITGGVLDCKVVGHPGDLKMSREMVKACCDKAHELGLKVAAHVEGPEGLEIVADCGVDTIEHGAAANDETLDKLKARDGALICTLSPAMPLILLGSEITGYGEEAKINSEVLVNGMVATTQKCLEKGIKVGLGTDTGCPYTTHYDFWRELVYFTKYINGVDNGFAIHTATLVNAQILGLDDTIGTIEEGKEADMLFVSDNPLESLEALRNPLMVVFGGRIFTKKNKKYLDIEKNLDDMLEKIK